MLAAKTRAALDDGRALKARKIEDEAKLKSAEVRWPLIRKAIDIAHDERVKHLRCGDVEPKLSSTCFGVKHLSLDDKVHFPLVVEYAKEIGYVVEYQEKNLVFVLPEYAALEKEAANLRNLHWTARNQMIVVENALRKLKATPIHPSAGPADTWAEEVKLCEEELERWVAMYEERKKAEEKYREENDV